MTQNTSDSLADLSMSDLFRIEAESQTASITTSLLTLERSPEDVACLESAMRAAHSLKGAARIINLSAAARTAHVMEDCFVAAQNGAVRLNRNIIDLLLSGVDLLMRIAKTPDSAAHEWDDEKRGEIEAFEGALQSAIENAVESAKPEEAPVARAVSASPEVAVSDRVLRVTAENLNRLLGLAAESLVESRRLRPFAESLLRLKRHHVEAARALELVREGLVGHAIDDRTQERLLQAEGKVMECRRLLADRLAELERYDRSSVKLSHRLYSEALACRMRPFSDGVQGFPRMVRDLARSLGKEARLELEGQTTEIDRDVLEKLEAPLAHLLRNALDHGIETPSERERKGKPAEGVIRLEAKHHGGRLLVVVADDGQGVDLAELRSAIVAKNMTNGETASRLTDPELLEFLFLPGFSMKQTVTEVSGRGVGLDVVQNMAKSVRGVVSVTTEAARGTRFQLQLPLTLSVMRTLLAEIAGEAYAFPLANLSRSLKLEPDKVESLHGHQHFHVDDQRIGLVTARQILEIGDAAPAGEALSVIVLGDRRQMYGVVVDRFLGERELVLQTLDSRLGKIRDISAGSLMSDGSPVLIIDTDDFIRSIEKVVAGGHLDRVEGQGSVQSGPTRKRVLIVDDSLTVREVERKLLQSHGYDVEVAVDGMDGWNVVRTERFDLIITDVDMPRMDGIELVTLIKRDHNLKGLPVMIVSYKDREEDRRRGLDAGADYYLTKGSFHDDSLLQAVVDLIGEAAG